jgi:hypothetical protein
VFVFCSSVRGSWGLVGYRSISFFCHEMVIRLLAVWAASTVFAGVYVGVLSGLISAAVHVFFKVMHMCSFIFVIVS